MPSEDFNRATVKLGGIKNNDTKVVEYAPPPWYTPDFDSCNKVKTL